MKTAFCRTIGSASLAAKVPVSCALTIIRPHPSPAAAHASPSIFLISFTISLTPASCASRPSRGNAATRSRYGLAGIRNALALETFVSANGPRCTCVTMCSSMSYPRLNVGARRAVLYLRRVSKPCLWVYTRSVRGKLSIASHSCVASGKPRRSSPSRVSTDGSRSGHPGSRPLRRSAAHCAWNVRSPYSSRSSTSCTMSSGRGVRLDASDATSHCIFCAKVSAVRLTPCGSKPWKRAFITLPVVHATNPSANTTSNTMPPLNIATLR
mmetsp:Transcript_5595/g.25209  ORF Transcript_5595/g.25209 Transcript_5595/m.25209 type:complete len:268 (+) Transcript_5595:1127-1930(+)